MPDSREHEIRRTQLSQTERVFSAVGALVLGLLATRSRSSARRALGLGGAALLAARASTGRSALYRALGVSGAHLDEGGGTDVTASITVARPRQEVYEFWHDPENIGRVLRHAEDVQPLGDGRSRWRMRGPAGAPVQWDAEMIDDHPGELVSWRSMPDSEIEQAGALQFADAPGERGTEVLLRMRYRVPGGGVGQLGAKLASPVTAALVREELGRAKQLLEAGAVATTAGQPHGPRG